MKTKDNNKSQIVIDEIAYWKESEDVWGVSAGDLHDSQKIDQEFFTEQGLVEVFGREIASKIVNDEGTDESIIGYPKEPNVHYLNEVTIVIPNTNH